MPERAVETEPRSREQSRVRTVPLGPFVTLSFEPPAGEVRVDLGRLTPVARALAEVMAAQPLPGMARCDVLLESRVPLRNLLPPHQRTMLSTAKLDLPDRRVVRSWTPWRHDDQDIHAWLEHEASKLIGWVPIRPFQIRDKDWRAASADAALAADELLSEQQALEMLRHLGKRITVDGWCSGQQTGEIPRPVRVVEGGQPRWSRGAVAQYAADGGGGSA